MYGQQASEFLQLFMLFGEVAATSVIACVYLLFRRGNAFAPDVTTSPRLRRWTLAFFASVALGHVWYMPVIYLTSEEDILQASMFGGMLDFMTIFPFAIMILLAMLQDRQRPLWPAFVMVAPLVAGMVYGMVTRSDAIIPVLQAYLLLLGIGFIIYMVREVRRYGRWLRDNYADLEHKEVRQSFMALTIILLVFFIYASGFGGEAYDYIVQVCGILLICYLLWRVETLSDLTIPKYKPFPIDEDSIPKEDMENDSLSQIIRDNISSLLQRHCIGTQLYLQHDLTLSQLAQAIGTNRFYLSRYFSTQGITYNAYINDLRINNFISRYHEAVKSQQSFTAQELASDSGYRSYSTFSLAFKQRMGQSVTAWMHEMTSN